MGKIFSHSKLSTYEQCPLKYKYRYVDKIIPEVGESIESLLGKSVHKTLEWIYTSVNQEKTPDMDEVIIFYTNYWKENYKTGILIVKKEFVEKDYFNMGVKFLIDYFNKHHPFKDGTLECEKRIYVALDEEGEYKIQGFIDRLVYNFETNEYEIHDYKTANTLPHKDKFEEDRQLALYAIALKDLFGKETEIKLIWHYLAHNTKIVSKRTNEQLDKLKGETIELIKEIEATRFFPYNKSPLCNWCEYKSMCPAWKTTRERQGTL